MCRGAVRGGGRGGATAERREDEPSPAGHAVCRTLCPSASAHAPASNSTLATATATATTTATATATATASTAASAAASAAACQRNAERGVRSVWLCQPRAAPRGGRRVHARPRLRGAAVHAGRHLLGLEGGRADDRPRAAHTNLGGETANCYVPHAAAVRRTFSALNPVRLYFTLARRVQYLFIIAAPVGIN